MSGAIDRLALEAFRALVREELEAALRERGPSAAPVEGFIGTAEAARRGGVKQATVIAWIDKGLLVASKPEGSRGFKIRPSDLEAFLAGRQGTGTGPPRTLDLAEERGRRLADSLRPNRDDKGIQ